MSIRNRETCCGYKETLENMKNETGRRTQNDGLQFLLYDPLEAGRRSSAREPLELSEDSRNIHTTGWYS